MRILKVAEECIRSLLAAQRGGQHDHPGDHGPGHMGPECCLVTDGRDRPGKDRLPLCHFRMSVPRLFFILSVEDNIRLELDFVARVERPK